MESDDYKRVKVVDILRETSAQKVGHSVRIYRPRPYAQPSTGNSQGDLWKILVRMIGLVLTCRLAWELIH